MTKEEYNFCESKWSELYSKRKELREQLDAITKEMWLLEKNVLNNEKSLDDIEFPY